MKEDVFLLDLEDYDVGVSRTEFVNFPSFYGLQKVKAPVFVHRASKEISPCVVVTACIHGDEINGMRIAQSLIQKKFKLTKGTLIIVPVVNIYGFLNKVRYLPDRKDLNRCFPGSVKGSFGARFADFVLKNITKYGDIFIDFHSGAIGRYNVPQVRCDLSQKNVAELMKYTSIPIIVNSPLRDGSMRSSMNDLGKPCIVFEGGEGLRIDETITKYGINLVRSVLDHLKMLKKSQEYKTESLIIHKSKWIRAKEGGIFISKTAQGKINNKGTVVGELRKLTGELITRIKMENDGVILGIAQTSMIMAGDALFNVGFINQNIETFDEEEEFNDYFDFEME